MAGEVAEQQDVCSAGVQANRRGCFWLNQNATDMDASVAVKSESEDWLNCYAETRPCGYREQALMLLLT